MSTIPISQLAQVNPSVIGAGGNAVDILALVVTLNTRVPIGTVPSFGSAEAVGDFFGNGTTEKGIADIYFAGFEGCDTLPSALLFAQYPQEAVAAYLRGGDISALTLVQLQAISGSLNIVIDGAARNAASVNLSAATSFSSAASIIQAALIAAAPAAASVTGSIGGEVTASAGAAFTATGSGTNLTASAVTGVIHVGAALAGTGIPSGTYIVSQSSGSAGGAGVYVTNHATTSAGDAIVASSNTLDVTAVVEGTLQPTDAVSGSGIATGTTVLAQLSGSPGGIGLYMISSQQHFASTTVTLLSTILNVTIVGSGSIEVGAVLAGTGVTFGTVVAGNLTGSGGVGTYTLDVASTTASETITSTAANPAVTYDSTSGGFIVASGIDGDASTIAFATGSIAASVKMTSATGAVLSQGSDAQTPSEFMDSVISVTTNFVNYMTSFNPDGDSGENTEKQLFSAWKNTKNSRYAYVCWDTDAAPTVAVPATGSLGYILDNNGDTGTCLIWEDDAGRNIPAFICGAAASIDFTRANGRVDFAYKSQAGLVASVSDGQVAINLGGNPQTDDRGNGYNFYGAYGVAADGFVDFQRGFVTGPFAWFDSYINQVWMSRTIQTALVNLARNAKAIPYTISGNSMIEAALSDFINQGLSFGAFAPGSISNSQAAQVNQSASAQISDTLQSQGYYLQVLPASSPVRAARTSPPIKFFYLDRGSVQAFTVDSVAVQ